MQIIIHRGTHQIGGCVTEYRTKTTRIFIDFGAELSNENPKPLEIQGVSCGKTCCDAVFFTHYHGDHIGLLDTINKDIPLYMGEASKTIAKILNHRLSKSQRVKSYDTKRVDSIKTFAPAKRITVGDITITPYSVDHSAYDAYMFLIEADGKRILHTGDFRTHGFRGKGVRAVLEKYVGKIDALVCEGTTLNRAETKCETEYDLAKKIKKVIEENKYVFILCSSTNIDRLAGVCQAVPQGRYCLCDKYQKSVIDYIKKYGGPHSDLYKFPKVLWYGENIDEKMTEKGFCMFVRSGNAEHKGIMEKYKSLKPVVIYSMWKGYLEDEKMKKFLEGYKRIDLHTSGHADSDAIKMVADITQPDMVIPMHTEVPEAFLKLVGAEKVKLAKDKEVIDMETKTGRTISEAFVRDLEDGVLSGLIDIVRNDDDLILCFRKDYINVYYKSHSIFKIEEQKKKYKFSFNLGHARYLDTFENIKSEVEKHGIVAKKTTKAEKEKNTYPYAVFSVVKNGAVRPDFSSIVNLFKRYVNNFFIGGKRLDLFQNAERSTNSLREKRHQQALFSMHTSASGEILFCDMELSLPKPKDGTKEMNVIKNEIGKHITGAPDCLAVRLDGGTARKIVLVEVKSTKEACVGLHGIKKHHEDFNKIINCSYYRKFIAESIQEAIKLYARLGLCGNIAVPKSLGTSKKDFEILYYFTHGDVIDWANNSGYDADGNKKTYEHLYQSNPQMFVNVCEKMNQIVGVDYN